jgi:hypothetical protein
VLVIIFIFWVVWGGREEYDLVGVKPLTTPSLFGKDIPNDYLQHDSISDSLIRIGNVNPKPQNQPTKLLNKGEDIVYEVLQEILESEVERNIRPDFLRNPETGKNLELDCYCEEYALAVEYNGVQHYKFPSVYHKTEEEFYNQVYRDRLKKKLCDEAGVYLISVPYWVDIYDSQEEHLNDKNTFKNSFANRNTRYKRIYKYLYEKIGEYFKNIFPQEQNDDETEDIYSGWGEYSSF